MSVDVGSGGPNRPPDHRDATYYAIPRRRRPVLGFFMWAIVVLLALGGAGLMFADRATQYALSNDLNDSPEVVKARALLAQEPKSLGSAPWNLLILGSDSRDAGDGGRSDSLMLVRLDSKQNFVSILSFPRDLFVQIPGYGPNKINAAYALGQEKLVIDTVQKLTGERIHHFFNIDFNAFRRLVNDAGGVYLDVDRWYFNDNSGRGENFEQLDIKPGYQRLGGFDALDYVRYRHTDSDFSRIARQQQFLSELKRQTRSVQGVNNILDAVRAEVKTSLKSGSRLRDFILFGLQTEKERIARTTVASSGSRMVDGVGSVVDTTDGLIRDAVDRWKNPTFLNDEAAKPSDPSKVIVWVYNGSKKVGVGTRAATALERRGYNVFFAGNAPEGFFPSTSVFYAEGKRNDAKVLQPLFGPNTSIAQRRSDQTQDADVVVMVGGDFDGLRKPVRAKPAVQKPQTVATRSLREVIVGARRLTGMDLLVPTHVPPNAAVKYVRVYNVDRGTRGTPNAVTVVLQLPGFSKLGGNRYVTITQTDMKDPPIVDAGTGRDRSGGGITFYNGTNMQRLLWQRGDMTYWITNSLDEALTAATIRDMRQFMVRPARVNAVAKKPVNIPVSEESRTP